MTINTIGVYGWTPATFIRALKTAHVSTVVDIRRRRGVRGPQYAFANSRLLQALLEKNGIGYLHELALAPPQQLLEFQHAVDKARHEPLRARSKLDPQYVAGYKHYVLDNFTTPQIEDLAESAGNAPALLCVEGDPSVCHRRLAAEFLAKKTGAHVRHLTPPRTA